MSNDYTPQTVEATLYYTYMTFKNFEGYSIDLGNLSDTDWDKIASMETEVGKVKNALIRTKEGHPAEGKFFMVKSTKPIHKFYWPDGRQLSVDEVSRLGQGTRVRIKVKPYTTDSTKYGRNIGANMLVAKVIEAVWYESDADTDVFGEDVVLQHNEVVKPLDKPADDGPVLEEVVLDKSDLDDEIPF